MIPCLASNVVSNPCLLGQAFFLYKSHVKCHFVPVCTVLYFKYLSVGKIGLPMYLSSKILVHTVCTQSVDTSSHVRKRIPNRSRDGRSVFCLTS